MKTRNYILSRSVQRCKKVRVYSEAPVSHWERFLPGNVQPLIPGAAEVGTKRCPEAPNLLTCKKSTGCEQGQCCQAVPGRSAEAIGRGHQGSWIRQAKWIGESLDHARGGWPLGQIKRHALVCLFIQKLHQTLLKRICVFFLSFIVLFIEYFRISFI